MAGGHDRPNYSGKHKCHGGCHQCSALFGAFFLSDDILSVVAAGATREAFTALATGTITTDGWAALVAARTSVVGQPATDGLGFGRGSEAPSV